MVNKPHPKEHKQFEFILTIEPKQKLSQEQDSFLFKNGLEKVGRTGLYSKKTTNFLDMFLCLDSMENDSPYLGLSQLRYTLVKKIRGETIWRLRTNQKEQVKDALMPH